MTFQDKTFQTAEIWHIYFVKKIRAKKIKILWYITRLSLLLSVWQCNTINHGLCYCHFFTTKYSGGRWAGFVHKMSALISWKVHTGVSTWLSGGTGWVVGLAEWWDWLSGGTGWGVGLAEGWDVRDRPPAARERNVAVCGMVHIKES